MSQTISVISGDGIGPEIMDASLRVLDALDCGLSYEFAEAGLPALEKYGNLLPEQTLQSVRSNIVTTNLFGDIISDLCAGLVGGLGLAPGANIGRDAAIFEAVHGSAPDIAGRNIANPCALLLAAAQMLSHLGMHDRAIRLQTAIRDSIAAKDRVTPDLGGSGNTDSFAEAIIERI